MTYPMSMMDVTEKLTDQRDGARLRLRRAHRKISALKRGIARRNARIAELEATIAEMKNGIAAANEPDDPFGY